MTLHVDPLEALWFLVNTITLILTSVALVEARRDLIVARTDTEDRHEAREITALGNLRREILRVAVQLLLLSVVVPGLFTDRPIVLTPALIALILIPAVLLTSTVFDARDRGKLTQMLLEMVRVERETLALESSVQRNIELTKEASKGAKAAYEEANTVNEKIARLTEALGHKEDKPEGST